jgi:Putative transposase
LRPDFFLPVRVLSCRFRRLFLTYLQEAFDAGKLNFLSSLEALQDPQAFCRYLDAVRDLKWVVYAKPPFAGPQQVVDYLGRYTHRVAISNHRLLAIEDGQVKFNWRDYRPRRQMALELHIPCYVDLAWRTLPWEAHPIVEARGFGHTPLSVEEKIPWKCRRLVVGTGEGALPVMPEVRREAKRRKVRLLVVPTAKAIRALQEDPADSNAILYVTCCDSRNEPTRTHPRLASALLLQCAVPQALKG